MTAKAFDAEGLPISRAGLPISAEGLPISRAGLPISAEGLPISRAGLPISAEGLPISRADLQLRLELRGKLNENHSTLLELDSSGTSVFKATISETWIREPETVQRDILPCRDACAPCDKSAAPRFNADASFRSMCAMMTSLG